MSERESTLWAIAIIIAAVVFVAGRAYCAPAGIVGISAPADAPYGRWVAADGEEMDVRCPDEVPAAGEVPLPEGCPAPAPAWLVSLGLRSQLEARAVAAEGRLDAEQQRTVHAMDATARALRACDVRLRRCAEGARLLAAAANGDTPRNFWLAGGIGLATGAAIAVLVVWLGGGL